MVPIKDKTAFRWKFSVSSIIDGMPSLPCLVSKSVSPARTLLYKTLSDSVNSAQLGISFDMGTSSGSQNCFTFWSQNAWVKSSSSVSQFTALWIELFIFFIFSSLVNFFLFISSSTTYTEQDRHSLFNSLSIFVLV